MATLKIGFSAFAPGIGGGGSDPDIEGSWDITLASGVKAFDQTIVVAANTPTTSTVLWQATKTDGTTQHGVSGASAAATVFAVLVDPGAYPSSGLPLGVRALYTNAAGAVLTDVAFQQRDNTMPIILPASVRDASGAEYFLTRIEGRNRNASNAIPARIVAWR